MVLGGLSTDVHGSPIRIPGLNSANKACLRVFRHQQVWGDLCHVDPPTAPGLPDKIEMNRWLEKKERKMKGREWRTQSSELMTGRLCITALTNEHSNKGEL